MSLFIPKIEDFQSVDPVALSKRSNFKWFLIGAGKKIQNASKAENQAQDNEEVEAFYSRS